MANTNLTIKERLTSPSPDLFVKIQYYAVCGGIILCGVGAYLNQIRPNSRLAAVLMAVGGFCTFVVGIISKLPVDPEKKAVADERKKAENNELEED